MATAKKKTGKAKVKVKDLKARKNPKGGAFGKLDRANKWSAADGSVRNADYKASRNLF